MEQQSHEQGREHAQESRVVMQADVVVDPEAVVVEFVRAPIALHTVLRVTKNIAVADRAVVLIVFLPEMHIFVASAGTKS